MIRRALLAAVALAASALGCDPNMPLLLQAETAPPPLAHADLATDDSGQPTLRLTKGVAFALACSDSSGENPCTSVTTLMSVSSVVSVSDGYLGFEQSGLVIVGLEPGTTMLTIEADQGDATLLVTVLDL